MSLIGLFILYKPLKVDNITDVINDTPAIVWYNTDSCFLLSLKL
jgi:hypothetical protein